MVYRSTVYESHFRLTTAAVDGRVRRMSETHSPQMIAPCSVRYIKLGPSGAWFDRGIREGLVEFGHESVPHEVALRQDRAELERLLIEQGRSPGKVVLPDYRHR